jgi:mannosyl-oligosaccharide alpha-1,2-mannosidase
VNLESRNRKTAGWLRGCAVLAEAGSIQLEFIALARESGMMEFETAARRAFDVLLSKQPADGLFPLLLDIHSGIWRDDSVSTGALGDSFYESNVKTKTKVFSKKVFSAVLIKLWIFDGASLSSPMLRAWNAAWKGIKTRLLRRSGKRRMLFLGEIDGANQKSNRMGHLSCHMPAVLALAYRHIGDAELLTVAEELAETCFLLYSDSKTGLGPEAVEFYESGELDCKFVSRKNRILFYHFHQTELWTQSTFCVQNSLRACFICIA